MQLAKRKYCNRVPTDHRFKFHVGEFVIIAKTGERGVIRSQINGWERGPMYWVCVHESALDEQPFWETELSAV